MQDIHSLVDIAQFYGHDREIVQSGGGNVSMKNLERMWVKLSGVKLKDIHGESDFMKVRLSAIKLLVQNQKLSVFPENERNKVVEKTLLSIRGEFQERPSIEIFLHAAIEKKFVIHTHPIYVNAMVCSIKGKETAAALFNESDYAWVPYKRPGFLLGQAVFTARLHQFHRFKRMPNIVFLQNHGLIIAGDRIEDIKILTNKVLSALRKFFGGYNGKKNQSRHTSEPTLLYLQNVVRHQFPKENFEMFISQCSYINLLPFDTSLSRWALKGVLYPDYLVYCGKPLRLEKNDDVPIIGKKISNYFLKNKCLPKYAIVHKSAVIILGCNKAETSSVEEILSTYIKTLALLLRKGQPRFLSNRECHYLAQWEAEKYRQRAVQLNSGERK